MQLGQDYLVRALGMHDADDALQSIVAIRNTSKTSARNPAMKVAFVGLAGVPEQPSGWQTASKDQDGVLDVQWEGGADYSVHGMWTRELPPLSLAGAYAFSRDPAAPITLLVELVADSFHERWTFPIVLSEETEAGDR